MVSKERIKAKIQHVLDAIHAIKEVEAKVGLCIADDVGATNIADMAGVKADAARGRKVLYMHLTGLTRLLLKAEKAECFDFDQDPKSEEELAILKLIAQVLISSGESGNRFEKTDQEAGGIFGQCRKWARGRASVCGREVTNFCDLWIGIGTMVLVVKLLQLIWNVDMGRLAKEHKEVLSSVTKGSKD